MPGIVRVQVNIPFITGIPRDVTENTFWFASADGGTDPGEIGAAAVTRLTSFYNATQASGHSLSEYYSTICSIATNACRFKVYDRELPLGSPPIIDEPWTLDASGSGGVNLPNEVALCASFRTNALQPTPSGTVRAGSLRGRVYLGPFNENAIGEVDDNAVPIDTLVQCAAEAAEALSNLSSVDCLWSIYSRVHEGVGQVLSGWVDNAWDTQRRRGVEASTRVNWTSP